MEQEAKERQSVEETLQMKVEELERFTHLATGREEQMIELKSEVNSLLIKLGQEEKYKTPK